MVEAIARRHELAALEQEIVDGLLDLQDVEVDVELGEALADLHHRAGGDELRDRGHRGEGELGLGAALQPVEGVGEPGHLLEDLVDLLEDRCRLGRRHEKAGLALEEPHPEALLGVLHQPADPGRGDVQILGRALDGAGHHDRADHLDLSQREIAHGGNLRRWHARGTSAERQAPYAGRRRLNAPR